AADAVADAAALSQVRSLCCSAFGGVTPAERFIAALVSPLVYGFISDSDGAPDNNGKIEGYEKTDRTRNVFEKISAFFEKLVQTIKNMLLILGAAM
ncbi:MAG: hypothetical protein IJS90_08570, partial [Clostridia bacterium]|nr:hypothetical protein [Clostridia bacterium]